MNAVAGAVWASAWLAACFGGPVLAAPGEATRCRAGQVEWIVGGAAAPMHCPTATRAVGGVPSARGTARPTPRAAGASARGDSDRDHILRAELVQEEATLARQLGDGMQARDPAGVTRTRANIAALHKELARP